MSDETLAFFRKQALSISDADQDAFIGGLETASRALDELKASGWSHVPACGMRDILQDADALEAWDDFVGTWDHLSEDLFMADGGRYRQRSYAVIRRDRQGHELLPPQPHYQSKVYNRANGGVDRWFEPISMAALNNPAFRASLEFGATLFDRMIGFGQMAGSGDEAFIVEAHQFRILAESGVHGQPTPEGMHRDGVDFVLVMLINRRNVSEGETRLARPDGQMLGSFTLCEPMETVVLDDHRVLHGGTPIHTEDPALSGARDVLVLTYRRDIGGKAL